MAAYARPFFSERYQPLVSFTICRPPGLIATNSIVCTIPALGGGNPVQKMTVQLGVTAPNQTGVTFLPSGTVSFLGNDSSQATATIKLKVN